ncbi:sensor domain-containing diguanylate cyclase [Calidifontibacillus oryziterrae]|uniref:sensor domain-containing diguanylate cyclase n=1 Tax=Calidifontibacillus oryziterrae TaxID=1191699 RepID=UPI0002ED5BE0|nr:diguanylate cyclase [Calidifontibacillus oryziterrae]
MIGNEQQIMAMRDKNIAYELFLFGSLTIIGAYHLALFFFRKKNRSSLFFGLFCLLIGLRTLLVGERFFIYLFPNFSWELAHKIQTLTFYLGVPLIICYFKSVFQNGFHSKIVRFISIVGIIFSTIVVLTPAKIFTVFNPAFQVFTFCVIIFILLNFIKIFRQKEKGINIIIVGALALIVTSLNDIIFLSIWMNDHGNSFIRTVCRTGNLSSVGQLIFVFANSLVLAQKYSEVLENEEVMTAKLKEMNSHLDELVIKRTEALQKSREKIEHQKLELEKANSALRMLTLKDPLTDLWNRRHYDKVILIEWNRCLRYERSISLLMVDIDNFKAFNDYYGHSAGDECLIQVAHTIKSYFNRAGDLPARYGGEEFVVIMPDLGKDDAINMALQLRQAVEDLKIPNKYSAVCPYVTVSIGVASIIPDMNRSPKDLFLAVDKALYKAKASGKNQVQFVEFKT